MRASTALVALAVAAVSAQTNNFTSELDLKINPGSVATQDRAHWCVAQTNTCSLLCENNTKENSCLQEDLSYKCTCASNNSMPGLQFYTQTMPTFICEANFAECNRQNVGSQDAQAACKSSILSLCGKNPPPKAPVRSSDDGNADSSSSQSDSTKATSSASGGAASATMTASKGLAARTVAPAANGAAAAAAMAFLAYL